MLGRNQKINGFHSFKIVILDTFTTRIAVQIAI